MQDFFQSILLGVVQGLTEFLPISSTAHLRIVPALLHWDDPGTAFSAVIQLGTMFAVIIYFFRDLVKIYGSLLKDLIFHKTLVSYESKLGFWILVGTIPICIFGLLFKNPLEAGLVRSLHLISFSLIFFGILLFISEIVGKRSLSIEKINFTHVLILGFAQSLALIPGVSRSGVTLLTGLFLGFKRSHAARFSFLLSVPAVFLSGVLELNTLSGAIQGIPHEWNNLILGILSAFVSGYFAIDFLLKYLETHKTHVFVIYRVVLGVLIIYLSYKGLIH